jgi:hypothetical protein
MNIDINMNIDMETDMAIGMYPDMDMENRQLE